MAHDPSPAPPGGSGADDLQFDRVEPGAPAGVGEPIDATSGAPAAPPPGVTVCAACGEPITDVYFEARGKVVCPRCRDAVLAQQSSGIAFVRALKALVLGVVGGAVGAAIWAGIRHASDQGEYGIVAIGVGLLVGGAVKFGSGGRGGRGYQILAVVLTYVAICANYVPDLVATAMKHGAGGAPRWLVVIVASKYALALPFMEGLGNFLGILIIAIALWEAWQINRPRRVTFNGPYRLGVATAFVPPSGGYPPPPPVPPVGGQ
jgi:hypothetical protein